MNNNLLTERALRDVFEITDYINFGTPDNPLQYGLKPRKPFPPILFFIHSSPVLLFAAFASPSTVRIMQTQTLRCEMCVRKIHVRVSNEMVSYMAEV
jgi:hypothetical protein